MNTKTLLLTRFLFKFIPVGRFFAIKRFLLNSSGAKVSKTARIYSNIMIYGNGDLEIGHDSFIGHEVIIFTSQPALIRIGNNVDIAPRVYIGTGSHFIEPEENHIAGKGFNKSIIINDGAWIGACSVILPGVTIGCKAVIGAGSVVNSDVPPYTIVAGVPCHPIKKWNGDMKEWISLIRPNY